MRTSARGPYSRLQPCASDLDYAKVAMLILKTNRKSLHTEAHKVVQKSAGNTMKVLKKGIERGEFRPDSNPYLV